MTHWSHGTSQTHGTGMGRGYHYLRPVPVPVTCAGYPYLCSSLQPPGIFSEGKHFHPRTFLETIKQIYEQVFLRPSGESPALEQESFARMLLDRSTTLESGTVLFKLYEELEIDGSTPDALLTMHGGVNISKFTHCLASFFATCRRLISQKGADKSLARMVTPTCCKLATRQF